MGRPATLCYIRKGGTTLMIYRNVKAVDLHKGLYVAPGGKIEPEDEGSLAKTMLRETSTETGLLPKNYFLKGFLTFANDERVFNDDTTAKTWGKRWDVAVYVAHDYVRVADTPAEPEGEVTWVRDDELRSLPMHEGDRMFTSWLDKEGYFIATFIYEEKRVRKLEAEFFIDEKVFVDHVKERYGECL